MPRQRNLVPVLSLAALLTACSGSDPGFRTLSGRVDTEAYALDNARIVAHSADGRRFLAALDRTGAFRIRLPVNMRYSLAIANSSPSGWLREISLITWRTASGRTRVVGVAPGADVDLGGVRPVGAATNGLRSASYGGGSDSSGEGSSEDHADDRDDDEDCEDREDTTVCIEEDHEDSECDQDDAEGLDCDDDYGSSSGGGSGSLTTSSGDGHGDDDHGAYGEDDSEVCQAPPDAKTPAPSTETPIAVEGTCTVNADCAAGLICVDSACAAPIVR